MKKIIFNNLYIAVITLTLTLACSVYLYASANGVTGRTLKTSNLGCGSCHGNNPVTEVMVNIIGPDTVTPGQTNLFFLMITKLSKTGAGLDISTRQGTLNPVSNNIHLSNGELTHNNNIPMPSGTVTVQFNYTAPDSITIDTIWATGLASNSDGTPTGDNWNWASNKKIIVRNPIGIKPISNEVPNRFILSQNYPNPFNPTTNIRFSVPSQTFVKLIVYDINGKILITPVNETLNPGNYEYQWNANNSSSGIYFYTLETPQVKETKKMILIK